MVRRWSARRALEACGLLALAVAAGSGIPPMAAAQAPPPPSEAIQKQREEEERRRLDYEEEKARVDRINARVRDYKQLMGSIPFELVPNTSNMVQVFMNGHDLHDVATKIYNVSDDATPEGFQRSYWPTVLFLNRAKDYETGMPQYGRLDPATPETNVALFPNIRKQGYKAVVADISNADSSLALSMTAPVVLAHRKRLAESVEKMAARGGDVAYVEGPAAFPGENTTPLFVGMTTEPQETYPPRRLAAPTTAYLATTDPVPVDRAAPLEPSPPAWAMRQGVNMLGPGYEGYNLEYKPDRFDVSPEIAPMAFLGGRDPLGNPHTQPGMHFGLNQRFFNFLLTNESAFVAFGVDDAPSMNGGSLNAGLDLNLGIVNIAGLVGLMGVNVIGEFVGGPCFTGKVRVPVGEHAQIFGLGVVSSIDHLRVEEVSGGDVTGGRTGVVNASYVAIGVSLR